ncbi:hypothetical protein [Pedobacter xixiisoli]|uniref:Uncharacterized protein n=1 Tax=Pedobacter xixiisoli TaxID=1476464 RepID=A0A285ZWU2_9SPHI|nr:hypothetical protein [Pedobacter xixiisoli]SOD14124.1 hypothetical protein SAMN06297358_1416 [Pedobacter xixiisoli]
MKTPDKNKSSKEDKTSNSKLKTEAPLAEKDEIKQAEDKQRKKSGK